MTISSDIQGDGPAPLPLAGGEYQVDQPPADQGCAGGTSDLILGGHAAARLPAPLRLASSLASLAAQCRVNSPPDCSGHAGGMTDPTLASGWGGFA